MGPPTFEMRGASASKLQSGSLELMETSGNNIKLTYFVSYKYILLALAVILVLACLYSLILLVLGAFLIITFGIELLSQKSNAKDLIARILSAEEN
ncbi:Flp pilus assembly protein TadB [Pedobacter sp. AK013]|nr:Flp pilus assembly protein TadB [Pedobacter sp. AK013]